MCGIVCIWHKDGSPVPDARLSSMTEELSHRGPDIRQTWAREGLGLGHARLKVLDLSDAANQPFSDSQDCLIYNGEIYNHLDLRQQLETESNFKTRSDTEVLFRALQKWGDGALDRISGQYAFIFFNRYENSLLIARDHAGICPLYSYETDRAFYFSSEIAPLLQVAPREVDPEGVMDYLTYRYNPQNGRTLFKNIRRFAPAHVQHIDMRIGKSKTTRYWRMNITPRNQSLSEASAEFSNIFDREITEQQQADVPVGLFLSGGIDSSALTTALGKTGADISAYSLRMDADSSETSQIRALENKYGFHSQITAFPAIDGTGLQDAVRAMEEPFGDLIICANNLLATKASKHVRVALSGEGGDEAFLGYDHQRGFLGLEKFTSLPLARPLVTSLLRLLGPRHVAKLQSYPGQFGNDELNRIITIAEKGATADGYLETISLFNTTDLDTILDDRFKRHYGARPDTAFLQTVFQEEDRPWKAIMRAEIEQLTLTINLLKQDRFCMAHSVESRVPLASRRVLEFAATLPPSILAGSAIKPLLSAYAGLIRPKKKAFSLWSTGHYLQTLKTLMDTHVTHEAIHDMGVLSWHGVEGVRQRLNQGTMLAVKQAMALVVLMVFWKTFGLTRSQP